MAERIGADASRPIVEELLHRSDPVHICLLVNRRHRSARIVDFLAGNFPQKQALIEQIAQREGIARVYTVVEREESTGWARLGYAREGCIPGYYKRSDAHVMGQVIQPAPRRSPEGVLLPVLADAARAEQALAAAKKLKGAMTPRGVRTQLLSEHELTALRAARGRKSVGGIDERFARTGRRLHMVARGTRIAEQIVSAEVQECFGNAWLQFAHTPTTEAEARSLVAGLHALIETLKAREVVSTFAFSPVRHTLTNAAMLAAGFRKTGLLAQHLLVGAQRSDAILWTRKIGSAAADADAA